MTLIFNNTLRSIQYSLQSWHFHGVGMLEMKTEIREHTLQSKKKFGTFYELISGTSVYRNKLK